MQKTRQHTKKAFTMWCCFNLRYLLYSQLPIFFYLEEKVYCLWDTTKTQSSAVTRFSVVFFFVCVCVIPIISPPIQQVTISLKPIIFYW
jgi:hypothetical protein